MTDPYNRNKIEQAVQLHNLEGFSADALRTAHDIDVRQDFDGNISYTDGSQDFASWMRKLVVERPHLAGKTSAQQAAKPAPSAQTASDLMADVRSGRMTADDATRRLLSARSSTPRPAAIAPDAPAYAGDTMTALMARARSGDRAALTSLTAKYLNPTR